MLVYFYIVYSNGTANESPCVDLIRFDSTKKKPQENKTTTFMTTKITQKLSILIRNFSMHCLDQNLKSERRTIDEQTKLINIQVYFLFSSEYIYTNNGIDHQFTRTCCRRQVKIKFCFLSSINKWKCHLYFYDTYSSTNHKKKTTKFHLEMNCKWYGQNKRWSEFKKFILLNAQNWSKLNKMN